MQKNRSFLQDDSIEAATLWPSRYADSDRSRPASTEGLSDTLPLAPNAEPEPRFIPGTVLLDRYRIVALIGRGAMGEIYRADDLTLREPVALKFLPESVASDGAMLARLRGEVRIAHQISHPNVCRVFDLNEVDGHHFLTMEYIDGENLASLLRRIGHPPQAKALQIAQQLCLGLAAAHGRGVLHRDVKPANVMIDGRGHAKITDFGLAGLIEEFGERDSRAGTPAYMAPEQLHGLEVSVRSDVYSLGLVLYELFTGHKAFPRNQRRKPPRPSTVVDTLDRAVEKTILDCLRTDPAERPASMIEVVASLPGGDPLAAAVAAGAIPSPEMVASAPREGALTPASAWVCLAVLGLELVVLALLCDKALLHRRVPFDKPPEVLGERARELVRELGFEAPDDEACGFEADFAVARFFAERVESKDRWKVLESGRPSFLTYWYRSSALPMPPITAGYWRVGIDDPPMTQAGMVRVTLDPDGRLGSFLRVPDDLEALPATGLRTAWSTLFRAAELDPKLFEPTAPGWAPPTHNDERRAWVGSLPGRPEFELRVEAAAYRGRPVYFRVVAPWSLPEPAWSRPVPAPTTAAGSDLAAFHVLLIGLIVTVLISGGVLAQRNLRSGRGDRRGASRLAVALFVIPMVSWLFWASHVPTFAELMLFMQAVGMALFRISFLWLVYMALEPFVRQSWPERIVSWSRFLSGRFRDPLVGRDLLIGVLFGLGMLVVQVLGAMAPTLVDQPIEPLDVNVMDTDSLMGLPGVVRQLTENVFFGPLIGLNFLFLLLLMTMILGRETWAMAACWSLLTLALNLGFAGGASTRVALALGAALLVLALQRYGLFTVGVATVCYMTSRFFPITADTGAWYFDSMLLALIVVVGPALYGGFLALAGQPFPHSHVLEDRVSSSVAQ